MKKYIFDYNYEAEAVFSVDTEKFTQENAKLLLDFFKWDYNKDGDLIEEILTKYAMCAIKIATLHQYNLEGVKNWFAEEEGFMVVDGFNGVELIKVTAYEFDEGDLTLEIE